MPTVTATEFKTLINDSEITNANAEVVLDAAIDLLNTYGSGLSNLSGSEGTKTLTVTSQQRGAIMIMARATYATLYKNAANANVNVANVGVVFSDSKLLSTAKQLAGQLKGRSFERT